MGYFGKHGCRKYLGFGVLMGVAWKVLEAMREREDLYKGIAPEEFFM